MLTHRFYKTFIFCGMITLFALGCKSPEIIFPAGDITIDAGESFPFVAKSYPDAIYKWTFDGGAKDVVGQNATVRFDRPGVYSVMLTVVFNDLESGPVFRKVTVNDPSTMVYNLSIDVNYEVTGDHPSDKKLIWIVERDGVEVMRRNAQGESSYTYHDNISGDYRIWLARFYDGEWSEASNVATYSVP